jgi:hypothetical protein
MTRFFFHVRGADGDVSRDIEGQELPGLDATYQEALSTHREMLGESLLHGGALDYRQIEVANEQGEVLAVLNAKDTLFQEGQLRAFKDDVTQSAPTNATASKPDAR